MLLFEYEGDFDRGSSTCENIKYNKVKNITNANITEKLSRGQ